MKVLRASVMGMCPGVRKALRIAREVPDPGGVTILGELVHNDAVIREIAERGFGRTPELFPGPLPATPGLLVTAHGTSDRVRARLLAARKQVVDTTCPLVRRIHRLALLLERDGRLVLLVGRPGHVELEGITDDLERFVVVPDARAVRRYEASRLGVLTQSTTPPELFEEVLAEICRENRGKDIRVVDTICAPTRDRQAAVRDLLPRIDALVVVGGRRSNNTRALVERAANAGVPVRHIESAAELDAGWLARFAVVGLAAGTSTLDRDIDAVERALQALPPAPRRGPVPRLVDCYRAATRRRRARATTSPF